MQASSWQKTVEAWSPPLLMLLAATLLLFDLGGRALWWDEIINVLIDRQDVRGLMTSLGALPGSPTYIDVHPPLFHLIQHFWIGLVGSSDFAVRFPNVVFALAALYLLYRVGLIIDGPILGKLALLIAGISPFWLLYARMARYYSLTALLGLGSTLLYLHLLKRPGRAKWIGYFALNVAMAYTDYLVVTLLICQMVYLVWARPGRPWGTRWIGAIGLLGLAYIPWLPAWYTQATFMNSLAEADLARNAVGIGFKFAFPLLSFTVGETVFPWELPAIVGYLLFIALLIGGVIYFLRRPAPTHWIGKRLPFMLSFTVIPTLGTIAVIVFITPTIPFIGIGNRTFFAFPFVALLAAAGLRIIERQVLRITAIVVLFLVYSYAIANYYIGRNFFNPIYAVPTETALNDILARSRPGDAIFSDLDIGIAYYLEQRSHEGVTHYFTDSPEGVAVLEKMAQSLAANKPSAHARIFVVTYGRDRTRRDLPEPFTQIITRQARLIWQQGYTPQNEMYRQVKQMLLGRNDYQYKLSVRLYDLSP